MFELRRLKMGDRPVTGQENKKNVEEFFNSRLNPSEESTSTEQHRPEAVLVEVFGCLSKQYFLWAPWNQDRKQSILPVNIQVRAFECMNWRPVLASFTSPVLVQKGILLCRSKAWCRLGRCRPFFRVHSFVEPLRTLFGADSLLCPPVHLQRHPDRNSQVSQVDT